MRKDEDRMPLVTFKNQRRYFESLRLQIPYGYSIT